MARSSSPSMCAKVVQSATSQSDRSACERDGTTSPATGEGVGTTLARPNLPDASTESSIAMEVRYVPVLRDLRVPGQSWTELHPLSKPSPLVSNPPGSHQDALERLQDKTVAGEGRMSEPEASSRGLGSETVASAAPQFSGKAWHQSTVSSNRGPGLQKTELGSDDVEMLNSCPPLERSSEERR